MGKVTGEEGWISLGPWGPRGWSQRSRSVASYKADGPVMEMTVHYNTESIDAISFQSESCDGVPIGCSEIIGSSHGKMTQKVRINSSVEQLLSISFTYNTFYMTSVTFHTNRNKYGPIGPFDEKDTTYSTPSDRGVIVGFHGCGDVDHNNRLLAIGIFVVPIVQSLHSIQDPNSGPSKDKMKEADAKNEVLRKKNEEMEKASNIIVDEGGAIPLGPWGGHGGSFWAYKTNVTPIIEITLRYGEIIDSVLFRNYLNGDVVGCSNRIGGTGGHNHKTISIDNSEEQLMSISLTPYNEVYISSLCFHSNRNSYGPYGTVRGPVVSIPIEEGAVLAGFHGRSGLYLDAIGIIVERKVLNS